MLWNSEHSFTDKTAFPVELSKFVNGMVMLFSWYIATFKRQGHVSVQKVFYALLFKVDNYFIYVFLGD